MKLKINKVGLVKFEKNNNKWTWDHTKYSANQNLLILELISSNIIDYPEDIAKKISAMVIDLNNINGFKVKSYYKWDSNLPTIMPVIGIKIESEIKSWIEGLLLLNYDQKLRKEWLS